MKPKEQFLTRDGETLSEKQLKKDRKMHSKEATRAKNAELKKKTPQSVFAKDNITSFDQYFKNLKAQETGAGHMQYQKDR